MIKRMIIMMLPAWIGMPSMACAQALYQEEKPVYMKAGKLGYDQKQGIVVAKGDVEVTQGASVLFADRIIYYQQQNIVRARGNVRVYNPQNGETYYGDEVELTDDLEAGIIGNFRARMIDNSQFAAREAVRVSADKTELRKAVYTACNVCKGRSPFWQLKADTVEIDEQKERVYYEDLQLEFFGVPVAYSPYFFHPFPESERASGFLRPTISRNSNLGSNFKLPYYFNIAPDKDATITPFYTSKEGLVMEGEYRQRTDRGMFEFNGSITNPKRRDSLGNQVDDREIRGHIFARGISQINDEWQWGFNVERSTDDTYLRRYRYSNQPTLNTRIFTQGLYGRSYARVQAMTFQGVIDRANRPDEPYILPLAEAYYESDPMRANSRFYSGANVQVVARDTGAQSRRLSLVQGVKVPIVTSGGHLIDVDTKIRTDAYSIADQPISATENFDGEKLRAIPEASVKWRYPLINVMEKSSVTIEPTVLALARPSGINPVEIPNEDTRIVEFTEANLFRTDPMPGLDAVDAGSRVAYGMRGQWLLNSGQHLQWLFGQNYSSDDTPFPYSNQPGERFSDYVGHVAFDYQPVTVSYRFRLNKENGSPISNILSSQLNYQPVRLNLTYAELNDDFILEDSREIMAAIDVTLNDEWSWNAFARRDILNDTMISTGTGILFQNECFGLLGQFRREFIRDRDLVPDTNFTVQILFQNLSGLQ